MKEITAILLGLLAAALAIVFTPREPVEIKPDTQLEKVKECIAKHGQWIEISYLRYDCIYSMPEKQ